MFFLLCFFVGYIAGLTVIGIPFPYLFMLAMIHDCTFYELLFTNFKGGMYLLPMHIGVFFGLCTMWGLYKKNRLAIFMPLFVIIGIVIIYKIIFLFCV